MIRHVSPNLAPPHIPIKHDLQSPGPQPPTAPSLPSPCTALQSVQNMVAIEGNKAGQQLQNCLVSGNFVLGPGSKWKDKQSAGVLLRGLVAPQLVNTAVIFQVRSRHSGHIAWHIAKNEVCERLGLA